MKSCWTGGLTRLFWETFRYFTLVFIWNPPTLELTLHTTIQVIFPDEKWVKVISMFLDLSHGGHEVAVLIVWCPTLFTNSHVITLTLLQSLYCYWIVGSLDWHEILYYGGPPRSFDAQLHMVNELHQLFCIVLLGKTCVGERMHTNFQVHTSHMDFVVHAT